MNEPERPDRVEKDAVRGTVPPGGDAAHGLVFPGDVFMARNRAEARRRDAGGAASSGVVAPQASGAALPGDAVDAKHQAEARHHGAGVGEAIRARRTSLGWTLQKLADLLGCAKGYLSEIETGKRPAPGDEVLARAEELMMLEEGTLLSIAHWERGLKAGGQTLGRELERLQNENAAAKRLADFLRSRAKGGEGGLDALYRSGELHRLIERVSPEDARGATGVIGAAQARGDTRGRAEEGERGSGRRSSTGGGEGKGTASLAGGANIARMPRALTRELPLEIPLINKVAAGYPREFTDLSYPARIADEYVRCPDVSDPDAFAARVVGDSMSPDYREGDVIVFSPLRDVKSGTDCFVRLERDQETTFKRIYFETGAGGEELIRLQPINNAYPPRVLAREDVAGCYVAVRAIREVG